MATEKPELQEVATTLDGRDITRGYVSPLQLMQPTDSVLASRGVAICGCTRSCCAMTR